MVPKKPYKNFNVTFKQKMASINLTVNNEQIMSADYYQHKCTAYIIIKPSQYQESKCVPQILISKTEN